MRETDKTSRVFFDRRVISLTAIVSIFTSFLLLLLYLLLLSFGIEQTLSQSILFASFATYILVIAFSFRDLSRPLHTYSLTENRTLLFGVVIGLALTLMTLYIPFMQAIFDVVALPLSWLMFVVAWLLVNVVIIEACKWFVNRYLVQ